jgi:hypothetical protein
MMSGTSVFLLGGRDGHECGTGVEFTEDWKFGVKWIRIAFGI